MNELALHLNKRVNRSFNLIIPSDPGPRRYRGYSVHIHPVKHILKRHIRPNQTARNRDNRKEQACSLQRRHHDELPGILVASKTVREKHGFLRLSQHIYMFLFRDEVIIIAV